MRSWLGKVSRAPLLIYPVLVFWACHQDSAEPMAGLAMLFLALLLPLWLAVRWLAKVTPTRPAFLLWLAVALGAAGGAVYMWRVPLLQIGEYYRVPFLLQDLSAFAFMAYVFGSTLAKGREPLCSLFARHVHGSLSPALTRYTRRLTLAWAVFFVLCGLVSATLYVVAPASIWAFVSNIVMPVLTLVFFVLETQFRRWTVPPEDYCGLFETFRSFNENSPLGKKIAGR